MSGNLPSKDNAALLWLEGHIAQWTADPAVIGLTAGQVALMSDQIETSRQARTDADTLHVQAKAATVTFGDEAGKMKQLASGMIAAIKGHAAMAANPSAVQSAAGIIPPAPRSPAEAPERAAILRAHLGGDGSITLDFKGRGPTGTVWNVGRQLAGETTFTTVGTADVATKSFTDSTLPAAISSATYCVQGVRGSLSGSPSFPMVVGLGSAATSAANPAQGQAAQSEPQAA